MQCKMMLFYSSCKRNKYYNHARGSEFSGYEIELRKMTSHFELKTRRRKIKT